MRTYCHSADGLPDVAAPRRRRLANGEVLYNAEDPAYSIYAVRFGLLKREVTGEDGRTQITAFHLAGDMVALDAVCGGVHAASSSALSDSEVCVIPLHMLKPLLDATPQVRARLLESLAKELTEMQFNLLALGSMRAEERLAKFLADLSARLGRLGYSRVEFVLQMTREEIGSYLGLTLETVSRLFGRFAKAGVIEVKNRHVKLIDIEGLREIAGLPSRRACGAGHGAAPLA